MATFSSIPMPVDLHDGNLVRYERHSDQLIAHINAWDATKVTLIFSDVWLVKEFDAIGPPTEIEGSLNDLRECFDTALIEEAKQRMKHIHCSESEIKSLRHFQLRDDNDGPVLEIVAYEMEIRHESRG